MLRNGLTPREIEVLDLMKEGHGDRQIAERLGLSTHTIKSHCQLIFARLGAANRTDAVVKALRLGSLQL